MLKSQINKINKALLEAKEDSGVIFSKILDKYDDYYMTSDYFFIVFSKNLKDFEMLNEETLKINELDVEKSKRKAEYLLNKQVFLEQIQKLEYENITFAKETVSTILKSRPCKLNRTLFSVNNDNYMIRISSARRMYAMLLLDKIEISEINIAKFNEKGFYLLKIKTADDNYGFIIVRKIN